ncbi:MULTISPECIES: hypothetical protein [Streptomycetaceae]|uniref:Uncharacterized protein n=1 Tax=Streptantibioticus cattleyicolor (strain ATCC 35852 / DSM 46488 / JCM 4925 / NBRC 14057 / NRRL 8057) TaxID=1003195 RepID=F8JXK1_STREN|nr:MULTISPECIES: hypothetical protein [Streptomycetaceae]AEW95891.1 hypothetical protein SCATT_35200 [Streptantibioticus cattleyicolor NRRL 8057 = DSM 46488]MYS60429.1 hypothetical protein [Streptomyces sp. SID5468]CCB76227.1 conserved exported protein of unknown function [Streptantibioticus cattleyicolor NRRL 8057 = DSM 46488]
MTLTALAITLLLAVTLGYALLCAASPFGNCRKCRGLGYRLTYDRKGRPRRGKHCRRCDGHGIRIRVGRHLFNLAARIHHDGTR